MKKILCLFSALTLVLISSCSSDDNNSESTNSVLLKKTIATDSDGEKVTTNFTYTGNKIVSVIDDTGFLNLYYTYTGDLITKVDSKSADGTVEETHIYTYNGDGKLVTFIRVEHEDDHGYKETYTYNTDGTISVKSYSGDSTSQTIVSGTSTIKFLNGEISEIISTNSPSHKYTYDTKNNPAKNVLGIDKIAFTDGEASDGIIHNMLTDSVGNNLWENTTFTYNENGYPTKGIDKGSDSPATTEYFY
ncbi:hypothetical protein [Flavobacterium sp. HJJ]|uniref:hypothetical protein n=1 Tax=Flavobacterium sp. HJJ TaxID=2783792 RepID=UPI00188D89DF|nr:hypothetical protein [Flavobacterium sp. HJJ]MBF4473447.1 hypothetical protein [Flavobacterium sp. HJJ]